MNNSRGLSPVPVIALVGGGIAVVALLWLLIGLLFAPSLLPWARESRDEDVQLRKQYVNRKAGYSFRYPANWRLRRRGRVAELVSASRDAVVSIGRGPRGSLLEASSAFVDTLENVHERVEVDNSRVSRIAGRRSLLVAGSAVNPSGLRLRFLTIIVPAQGRNFAIAIFAARGSDLRKVLPPVQRIVASFRTLPTA